MRTPKTVRRLAVAAALPLLLLLAGCGGTEFGTDERAITVDQGEKFSLEVPARPPLGEHWYLADPRPDGKVLEYRGTREETEGGDKDLIGSGDGTAWFDFTALRSGRATVKLLHCPMARCSSAAQAAASASPVPTATGTPDDEAAYFLYEITVR